MNAWKRIAFGCLSLLLLGLAPIGAALAQVRVTSATPSSAYQGTISLDVVVGGSGFDNSAKVQYFVSGTTNPGGITVRRVVFRNSTELVTTLRAARQEEYGSAIYLTAEEAEEIFSQSRSVNVVDAVEKILERR